MTEPYQACALYQQLVRHLQKCAAEELAALRRTRASVEYEHFDQIIRDWLFTPQRELYSCSPREVMRREQLGEPNVLPPPSPDEDEFVQELHEIEELLGGEPHHWVVDDGGRSLLDEFDPEGAQDYFRIMDERAAAQQREDDLLGPPPDDEEGPFSQN